MAWNDEDKITWAELAGSLKNLFKSLQSQVTREVMRAKQVEQNLDDKIDAERVRAEAAEWALNSTNPNSINSPSNANSPLNPNNPSSPLCPNNPSSILNPNNSNSPLSPNNPNGILNPNNSNSPLSPNNPNGILNPSNSNSPLSPNNPNGLLNPANSNSPLSPNNPNGLLNPANSNSPLSPNKPGGMLNPNNSNSPLSPNNANSPLNPKNPDSPLSPNNPTGILNPNNTQSPLSPNNADSPLNPDNENNALGEKMSRLDFCNMAPKIGFYQEDTVSVMPKYNMNCTHSHCYITTDSNGNEVMYFIGSSGEPARTPRLFKAYRTSNKQQFMFDNNPMEPAFAKALNTYVNGIIGLDNDWIAVTCANGRKYLVDTKYTYDESYWSSAKDISSISTASSFYYYKNLGTIVIPLRVSTNLKDQYTFEVRVYRYSDLALIKTFKLEGSKMYYGSYPYSLFTDIDVKDASAVTTDKVLDGGWGGYWLTIFYDLGLIVYNKPDDMRATVYDWNNNKQQHDYVGTCSVNMSWSVPKAYFQNNSTGNGVNVNARSGSFIKANYPAIDYQICTISLDSFNDNTYYLGYNPESTSISNALVHNADQNDQIYDNTSPYKEVRSGTVGIQKTYYTSKYLFSADASYWGKRQDRAFILFDKVFYDCRQKINSGIGFNIVRIKQFQLMSGRGAQGYVEPKAGQFFKVGDNYDMGLGNIDWRQDYGNYFGRGIGYDGGKQIVSVRLTNNQPLYLNHRYDSSTKKLIAYRYVETSTPDSWKVKEEEYRTLTFDVATRITSYAGSPVSFVSAYHNPIANNWILCYKVTSGPNISKFVLYTVTSSGSIISYNNIWSKWTTSDSITAHLNKICEVNTNGVYSPSLWISNMMILSATEMVCTFQANLNWTSASYCSCYKLSFNSSYNNFTTKQIAIRGSAPHVSDWYPFRMPGYWLYSGPVLGIVSFWSDGGWYPTYQQWFVTQKPMPLYAGGDPVSSYTAVTATDDEILNFTKLNRYYITVRSSIGLVCYIPNISIFLGGYFSTMEESISVPLEANTTNYIYMERPKDSRDKIIGFASTNKMIPDGSRQFSRILVAAITTDSQGPTDITYYHINTGYNDYMFHHNQYYS